MNEFKLKELLEIKNGKDYKHLSEGNIPVYGSGGLMRYVNESLYNGESILLPRKGTLSNIQYVKEEFWTVDTIYYSIVDKEKAEPYYLYYYLRQLDLNQLNSGTGVPSMTFGAYYGIPIKLPELKEQKAIAKVLSDLDAKIELNNKINAELEGMAKLLYDYWFVQFDFPDANGKPYKSSGGKMVYNEALKRDIPEGWEVKSFGDYSTVKSGFAFKSSWWQPSGLPVVKIKDIQEDYTLNQNDLSFVSEEKKDTASQFKSKEGDVVIAMTGATIGKFAMIPKTELSLYINQRVGLYDLGDNPFDKIPFLLNSMKQELFRAKVFQIAGGAAQPNISGGQLDSFPLINPSKDVLNMYNEKFKPLYKKIANNIHENQKLSELRDWLLPMLMNGQVTVGE